MITDTTLYGLRNGTSHQFLNRCFGAFGEQETIAYSRTKTHALIKQWKRSRFLVFLRIKSRFKLGWLDWSMWVIFTSLIDCNVFLILLASC